MSNKAFMPSRTPLAKALGLAIAVASASTSATSFAGITYVITDLQPLAGNASAHAQSINYSGQIVGFSDLSPSSAADRNAVLWVWQAGGQTVAPTSLGQVSNVVPTGSTWNVKINDPGEVMGNINLTGVEQAVFWNAGAATFTPIDGTPSIARGINNAGQVVGTDLARNQAFVWQNGTTTYLPGDEGLAINNATPVQILVRSVSDYSLLSDPNPIPSMTGAIVSGINDSGQAAGNDSSSTPTVWLADPAHTPVALPGSGEAYAINNAAQVVGQNGSAILWYPLSNNPSNGWGQVDLNSYFNLSNPTGLRLAQAFDINELGQIVGEAAAANGDTHGFVATPTGTLSMGNRSGTAAWDNPADWDSNLGFTPNALLGAEIPSTFSSSLSLAVTGPAADTTTPTLTVGGAGASGPGGPATLTLGTGVLTVSQSTTLSTGGTLVLAADNQLVTPLLTVDGGTLDLGGRSDTVDAVTLLSGTIQNGSLTSKTDFNLQSGTVSANLAGSVGLVKGSNDLSVDLSGNNTYTGQTTINVGALNLVADGSIANSGRVEVNSPGILDISATNAGASIRSLAGNGTVLLSDRTLTITNAADTFSGTISDFSDGGGVRLLGGTQTFSGVNDYTGLTDIQGGTLTLAGGQAILDTGAVAVGASGTLNLAAGSDETIGSLAGVAGGRVTLDGNTLTVGANGLSTVFAGEISGNGLLVKEGTGNLTLSGANTWTGLLSAPFQNAVVVNGGVLTLAGGHAIDDNGRVTLSVASSTLDLATSETLGSLGAAEGSQVMLNANTLTTGGDNTDGAIFGVISGSGGLVKQGTGLLLLSGANTYTGDTRVQAGMLALAGGQAIADTAGTVVVDAGATLSLSADETIYNLNSSGVIDGVGHTLTAGDSTGGGYVFTGGTVNANLGRGSFANFNGTLVLNGSFGENLAGSGMVNDFIVSQSGTVRLGASDRLEDTTSLRVVRGGVFDLGGFSDTVGSVLLARNDTVLSGGTIRNGTLNSASGYAMESGTVDAVLAGAGGLVKTTADTVTLSGANTYTGLTTISGGSLALVGAGSIADSSGVVDNGSFDISNTNIGTSIQSLSGSGLVVLGTRTLTLTNASGDFGGGIQGLGRLVLQDGVQTLSGVNTYTGSTDVLAGTLRLAGGAAIADGGEVSVGPTGTLELVSSETIGSLSGAAGSRILLNANSLTVAENSSGLDFAGAISGTGGFVKQGSGDTTLSGINTYTGLTDVQSGILTLSGGSAIADSGAVKVAAGATLNLLADETVGSLDSAGTVDGTGRTLTAATYGFTGGTVNANLGTGVLNATAGTTLLNGTSVAGTVNVTGGSLVLGAGNRLADTAALNLSGGSFDLGGFTDTVGAVTLIGGTIQNGSLTGSSYAVQAGTVSANLAGTGGLTKTTAGTVTLSGANTYTGLTDVQGGVLALNGSNAIADTGAVKVAAGATLNLLADETVGSLDSAGTVDGTGRTLTAATYGFTGGTVNANLGTGILNATAGTTTLNGTAAAGTVNVSGGSLVLGAANRLADTAALNVSGGSFDLGGFTDAVGAVTLTGGTIQNGTLTGGSYALQAGTVSANLAGTGGLTKTTAGTATLSGTNTYTGLTDVQGGVLALNGGSAIADSGAVKVAAGATLNLLADETVGSLDSAGTVDGTGRTLTAATYGFTGGTVNANLGTGVLNATAGTTLLNGTAAAGTVNVTGGSLVLGAGNRLADTAVLNVSGGSFDLGGFADTVGVVTLTGGAIQNGTLTGSSYAVQAGTVSANLAGTGGLTKTTAGTVTLSGANTYTGSTDVQAGILNLNGTLASGTVNVAGGSLILGAANRLADTAALNVSGGSFDLGGFTDTVGAVTLTGGTIQNGSLTGSSYVVQAGTVSANLAGAGGLTKTTAGTVTLSGANTYTGLTDVQGGVLALNGSNTIADTGAVKVAAGATLNLLADETVGSLDSAGTLDGAGRTLTAATYGLTGGTVNANLGAGVLTTTSGTTTLNGTVAGTVNVTGGSLVLGAGNRLADTAALNVSGGSFDLSGFTDTVGAVTLTGGTIQNGTLTGSSYAVQAGTVSANLAGGGLTKTTAGTVTLSGSNTYTGLTDLQGGILTLSGGSAIADTGAVKVAAGATLNLLADETVGSLDSAGVVDGAGRTLTAATYGFTGGTVNANLGTGVLNATAGTTLLNGTAAAGTVNVNGGTLALGGNERLADSATLTVNSTLDMGGHDETVGTVALNGGTIQNGGTLTAANYNLNGGTVNANLGSGTVNATVGVLTLNGSVGAGTLNVTGGELTLNGAAASVETVNVSTGTLALGGNELLSDAAAMNLNAGGVFDLMGHTQTLGSVNLLGGTVQNGILNSNSDFIVQSGVIDTVLAGAGGLIKIGPDTAILNQVGQYTGLTTVNQGILALGGVGSIASSSGLVVDSEGVFDITDASADASVQSLSGAGSVRLGGRTLTLTNTSGNFTGDISGSGGLTVSSGSQTLGGVNSYTGLTRVNSGASLNLTGASGLIGGLSNQGKVNISGSGSPHLIAGTVTNDGTFKLNDTSVQYEGEFVNNGAYISDPSTSQFNDLTVGQSGYLVGGADDTFIVTGNFYNASTQNTLWDTSQSNLVFASSSSGTSPGLPSQTTQHVMELAGVDKGAKASGAVNNFAWGSVTLNSGNTLSLVDGNTTNGAALYARRIILPGGVGELGSISSDYNVYYDPTLADNQYLLGSTRFGSGSGLLLPWNSQPFGEPVLRALTPNQHDFAQALNEACTVPIGVMVQRCQQLQSLTDPQQRQAIASLTPDQIQGQVAKPILFGVTRLDAVPARLAALRSGGGSGAVSFNFNGVQLPLWKLSKMLGIGNAKGGSAGDGGEPFRDSPLGVFVQARFDIGDLQNTEWARGFNSLSRVVTIGADYRFSDQLVTGLAFNYTNTTADFVNSSGNMSSDTYLGSFYGSYYLPKDFYVDWLASYGGTDYTYNRHFQYVGFAGQTRSNPSGDQFGFALSGGKEFSWEGWSFNPFMRWEYLNLHVDSFQEKGGNGFNISTGGQTNQSFTSNVGLQISHAMSMSWGVLLPSLRVDWEHQYLNANRSINMRLSDAAPGLGNFIIQTGNPDRDYVNLGGSVSATLPNGGAGFLRYQTRLGQAAIADHIVEAGVRMSF